VIAVDTNILVYAHRGESPWHTIAKPRVIELAEGPGPWMIPWQCLYEFFSVTTNSRIWKTPTPPAAALKQIETWLGSPSLVVAAEGPDHWSQLRDVARTSGIAGPKIHDAHIAALCREHGVTTLWSADRDFSRFVGLKVVNPLVK
jgi:uncharacterized protein